LITVEEEFVQDIKKFKKFGIGIDVHKEFSIVSVFSSNPHDGIHPDYEKTDRFQMTPQGLAEMIQYLSKFPAYVIGFESTGPYSLWVYKTLLTNAFPKEKLFCTNALFAKSLPGRKSDKIDAMNLAKYAFYGLLKASYIPEDTYQLLRRLTRGRKRVTKMMAAAENRIIMLLDRAGLRINHTIDLFAKYGLDFLVDLANGTSLQQFLATCPSNAHILQYKDQLLPFASIELLECEQEELKAALLEYCFLTKQVMEYERSLHNFIKQDGNKPLLGQMNILLSVPSIGPISAFEILAELGNLSRFNSLKKAQCYTGLIPSLVETGGKEKQTKILKRGNRHLRTTLFQCAQNFVYVLKNLSPPLREYITKLLTKHQKIKKKIKIVVAKKLLRICIALLRSGRTFESEAIIDPEKIRRRKEIKNGERQINYFKRQISRLNEQFNFSFTTLKDMVDEVADFTKTHSSLRAA